MTPGQSKAIAVAFIVSMLCLGAFMVGRESGLEKYYELKSQVDSAQESLREEAKRREEEHRSVIERTVAGWAAATDVLARRGTPIVRVLRPSCGQGQAGSDLPAAGGAAVPVEEPGSGPARVITPEECEARIGIAVNDAVRIEWLRSYFEELCGKMECAK